MICLLLLAALGVNAEGTKQWMPNPSIDIRTQIFDNNDSARSFMTYIATEPERLNIHIDDVNTEKIYFAFRQDNGDVYFRLRDPLGNIVYGPQLVPSSGNGYLASYNEAVAGPDILDASNGYSPLSYTPSIPGDYYIEFNRGDADNYIHGTSNVKRLFNFFDITVVDMSDTTEVPGRLWSKAWDFNCMSSGNTFDADLFIYHNDSILTNIDFNGIRPFGFVFLANNTGPRNTGNPLTDRQSVTGNVNFPLYKIFLQYPDTNIYPITTTDPQIAGPSSIEGCDLLSYDINVTTTHNGVLDVYLNLDGVDGYQSGGADVYLAAYATIGTNTIPWDGNDGNGVPVGDGVSIDIYIQYNAGLTHIPIFDVENHDNGYLVNTLAPTSGVEDIFWDDSNIVGGGTNLTTACSGPCHTWGNSVGNVNTINTWWITHYDFDTLAFTVFYDCAPEAQRDTFNIPRNTPTTVDVQDNDSDPNGDALTTFITVSYTHLTLPTTSRV